MSIDRKPIAMLNEQQLARLFLRLEVPVAIQSVLDAGRMDDADRLALHDALSCQTPDQALLSVAIASMLLDARLRAQGEDCAEILSMTAEMIVQDYAPFYVEQTTKKAGSTLFDRDDIEFLESIPEDLEALSDLLSVVADVLPASQRTFRVIAEIMAVQASAQALVAQTIVESFGGDFDDEIVYASSSALSVRNAAVDMNNLPANVIPFRKR